MRHVAVLAILGLTACTTSDAWFTPGDDITSVVVGEVGATVESVDLAIYTFTDPDIRDALVDAAATRGVTVRVCADAEQSGTIAQQAENLSLLADAGADVRVATGHGGGIMHHKVAILDGRTVLTGSFNYTLSANHINDENLLALTDPRLAEAYQAAFDELWARCEAR